MQSFTLLLVLAALVAAYRVYLTVKAIRKRSGGGTDDWDERLVKNLRAQGGNPFANHDVDFFFDLPTEQACQAVAGTLREQGFEVDYKAQDPALGTSFSLHAIKSIRISVPDMQGHSQAFRALATGHGGRYDGWATAGMNRETLRPTTPRR
jgi:NADPH:quinone reductase-like Zn-dependent oxidoreductase